MKRIGNICLVLALLVTCILGPVEKAEACAPLSEQIALGADIYYSYLNPDSHLVDMRVKFLCPVCGEKKTKCDTFTSYHSYALLYSADELWCSLCGDHYSYR